MMFHQPTRHAQRRRGSMLAELVVSSLLVGLLLAAALTSTGQSLLARRKSADRVIGRHLAQSLLAEIQTKAYEEPGATLPLIGIDLLETLSLRSGLDDVDDYHGYTDSPPKGPDGAALTQYSGWSRSVQVTWVNPTTLTATAATNTGIKQITVTCTYNGVPAFTAYGYRTAAP